MHVLIATDAWHPQVNGVVNTYMNLARYAEEAGFTIIFVTPEGYRTFGLPSYKEIRLAMIRSRDISHIVENEAPDVIHIATEGPIGLATRRYCRQVGRRFTTSYHTRFPEYVSARLPVPVSWGYRFQRWFHNAGCGIMAATPSLCDELTLRGLKSVHLWSRGVDLSLFVPQENILSFPRPIFAYIGRVAIEKNIRSFLDCTLPGTKMVVGGGPQLEELKRSYKSAVFMGPKFGKELAAHYASADVFVFPSLTDTFGNVILEAMACGTPVAAYPVTGPKDVVINGLTGILNNDLEKAARDALRLDRYACRNHAERFSWLNCAERFRDIIEIANQSAV